MLMSSMVLTIGVMLQAAALGKHVYDITGRELSIGWLGLAEFVPSVLLVLVTGVVADRFSRKHVGAIGIAGDALCSVVLVWVALSEPAGAGAMYSLAFLYGVFRAFANPAIRSIPAMIAPAGGLPRLVAMNSTTWQVAAIVGPAASGFLYAVDPAVPYAVAGVFLLAGVVLLLVLKVPRHRVDDAGDEGQRDRRGQRELLLGVGQRHQKTRIAKTVDSTRPAITGTKHFRARVSTGIRAKPATAISDDHATSVPPPDQIFPI